jgi:hypothetical protein
MVIAAWQLGTSTARAAQAADVDETVTVNVRLLSLAVSDLDKLYARLEDESLTTVFPDLTQDSQLAAAPPTDEPLSTAAWTNQITRQPVTLGNISPQAAFDVIQLAKKNQYSNIMTAPSLQLVCGQDGTISDITSHVFVTGYEADLAEPTIAFPQKTNVNVGTNIRVQVQRTVDGQFQVTGVWEWSELKSVKQTVVRTGPARGRELQVPELAYRVVRFDRQLADQQWLLVDTGSVQTPTRIEAKPRGFGFFTNSPNKVVNRDTSLFLLLWVE